MFWVELLVLIGSFVGTAFALVKLALHQYRSVTERFIDYLEALLGRQEANHAKFQVALDRLSETVRENSGMLARIGDRMGTSR